MTGRHPAGPAEQRASSETLEFGPSHGVLLLLALWALSVLLPFVLLVPLALISPRATSETRMVALGIAAVVLVIVALVGWALSGAAPRVVLMGGGDELGTRLVARSIRRRYIVPIRDIVAIETSRWDLAGFMPRVRHRGGTFRLLAISGLPRLARAITAQQPSVHVRIGPRIRALKTIAGLVALIGVAVAVAALLGQEPGRDRFLLRGVSLATIGAFVFVAVSVARPSREQRPPTQEGYLPDLSRPGLAMRQGRRPMILIAVAFVALAVVNILNAFVAPPGGRGGPPVLPVIAVLGAVGAVVIVALSLAVARRGGNGVALSPEVLVVYAGYELRVPWDGIEAIEPAGYLGHEVIRIRLTSPARAGLPRGWRILSALARWLYHADIVLAPTALGFETEVFYRLLVHYRSDPASRGELGTGAAGRRLAELERQLPPLG